MIVGESEAARGVVRSGLDILFPASEPMGFHFELDLLAGFARGKGGEASKYLEREETDDLVVVRSGVFLVLSDVGGICDVEGEEEVASVAEEREAGAVLVTSAGYGEEEGGEAWRVFVSLELDGARRRATQPLSWPRDGDESLALVGPFRTWSAMNSTLADAAETHCGSEGCANLPKRSHLVGPGPQNSSMTTYRHHGHEHRHASLSGRRRA